jgi:hypothetical protein
MGRSSDEKGAEKAVAIRRSQQKERARLQSEISSEQKTIATISEERAPIAAEVRKVEAEVGPIKYIAKFIYGEHGADENMLEKSVTWIIILIVIVFDPLAVIMLLAAQMTFGWSRKDKEEPVKTVSINDFVPQPTEFISKEEITETDQTGIIAQEVVEVIPEAVLQQEDAIEAIPVEQWNKMIAEAEAEVEKESKYQIIPELQKHIDESTVEERVAKGETYIDGTGHEVTLEEIEAEESKKKTYMTKNSDGQIQIKNRS